MRHISTCADQRSIFQWCLVWWIHTGLSVSEGSSHSQRCWQIFKHDITYFGTIFNTNRSIGLKRYTKVIHIWYYIYWSRIQLCIDIIGADSEGLLEVLGCSWITPPLSKCPSRKTKRQDWVWPEHVLLIYIEWFDRCRWSSWQCAMLLGGHFNRVQLNNVQLLASWRRPK